jgi:predicted ATPase/class 3 adenylate cyclase
MAELPGGTVTFLFTDVEGSTALLRSVGKDAYAELLAEHARLIEGDVADGDGRVVDTQGDAFFAAFPSATAAVTCAAHLLEELAASPLRVRIGIHTGQPALTSTGYVGLDVPRAARICSAAHGGQALLSQTTRELVEDELSDRLSLRDLGEHRLKDLTRPQRLSQLVIPGLPDEFPALRTLENRPTNLPVQPTPLVGRTDELADVLKLVRANRLVTLTGPGGSGKTRLALASAAELADDFADGVWFVSLASLSDTELVEPTIAQVLGARGDLNEFLRGKQLLLLLDNLEQLLPDVAETVAGLEAKVLATSRERLNLSAEHEYPVPMLPPEDAVELFTQRARQLELRFQPDEHVPEIARRLDGLPLALELAAARVKTLTPQQIVERLAQSLDLLTGGARDAPGRQQTLRATLEWSYELLDQQEQTLFVRLAVFVGGCTLDAAEQVAGAQLDLLQSLVDKNLLRHSNERFWMLETIRALALEKLELLDEAEQLRRRHAEYLLEFVKRMQTVRLDAARFGRAKAESPNVRAAVEWALSGQHTDLALTLASTQLLDISPRRRARWLDAALLLGDRADPSVYANALRVSAGNYYFLGQFDRAETLAQRSLAQFRALRDRGGEGGALHIMGLAAGARGEHDRARELLEHALELVETSGETTEHYRTLHSLGELDCRMGNLDRAAALLEQSLQLALDAGDTYQAGKIEHGLGDTALAAGNTASAKRCYLRALSRARELDYRPTLAYCLAGLASVAAMRGERKRAGRLWGALQAFQRTEGVELLAFDRRRYEEALATITGPRFERAANATRNKQPDEALAAALADEV